MSYYISDEQRKRSLQNKVFTGIGTILCTRTCSSKLAERQLAVMIIQKVFFYGGCSGMTSKILQFRFEYPVIQVSCNKGISHVPRRVEKCVSMSIL